MFDGIDRIFEEIANAATDMKLIVNLLNNDPLDKDFNNILNEVGNLFTLARDVTMNCDDDEDMQVRGDELKAQIEQIIPACTDEQFYHYFRMSREAFIEILIPGLDMETENEKMAALKEFDKRLDKYLEIKIQKCIIFNQTMKNLIAEINRRTQVLDNLLNTNNIP